MKYLRKTNKMYNMPMWVCTWSLKPNISNMARLFWVITRENIHHFIIQSALLHAAQENSSLPCLPLSTTHAILKQWIPCYLMITSTLYGIIKSTFHPTACCSRQQVSIQLTSIIFKNLVLLHVLYISYWRMFSLIHQEPKNICVVMFQTVNINLHWYTVHLVGF